MTLTDVHNDLKNKPNITLTNGQKITKNDV